MLARNANGRLFGEYQGLVPDELRMALDEDAIVYLPMGSLEWHNTHLPYNTDSIIGEELCKRLAERTGGLVLPPNPWATSCTAVGTGPFPCAHAVGTVALFDTELYLRLLRAIARGVILNGFRRIVILAGHVAGDDRRAMEAVADEVNAGREARALFLYPYLFTKGDHAGHWETLMVLGLRPESVRDGKTYIHYGHGHPLTGTESIAEGREKVDALVDALAEETLDFFRQPDEGTSTS